MNNFQTLFGKVAAVAALFLTPPGNAQVRSREIPDPTMIPPKSGAQSNDVLVVANATNGVRLSTFAGRSVLDRANQRLGTVKDVYVDAHSGKGVYAAVASPPSRGLRLVPFAVIGKQGAADAITLNITRKDWEQIAPANSPDVDATRLSISAGDSRQLAQLFGLSAEKALTGVELIAIAELHGKRVSTGSDNVGMIDDVRLANDGVVAAIISPEKDFSIAERKFVVPVRLLKLGARDLNPIMTDLTRSDFEGAQQSAAVSSTVRTARSSTLNGTPSLTPTGRDNSTTTPPNAFSLSATLEAVQDVLANEPPPSSAKVRIEQENGKLQLRGTVGSQAVKEKVERVVRQSAPNARIDNQIQVEPR